MKTSRDITNYLRDRNELYIECDTLEDWEYIIDYHTDISWWLEMTREQYSEMEKRISEVNIVTNDYEIYAWCDVSWYDYWVLKQEEYNYIVITLKIKNTDKDYSKEELDDIDYKIFNIIDWLKWK